MSGCSPSAVPSSRPQPNLPMPGADEGQTTGRPPDVSASNKGASGRRKARRARRALNATPGSPAQPHTTDDDAAARDDAPEAASIGELQAAIDEIVALRAKYPSLVDYSTGISRLQTEITRLQSNPWHALSSS